MKGKLLKLSTVLGTLGSAAVAGATTPYDSIVTAADISGLNTAVVGILATAILIPVTFVAFRLVKKAVKGAA